MAEPDADGRRSRLAPPESRARTARRSRGRSTARSRARPGHRRPTSREPPLEGAAGEQRVVGGVKPPQERPLEGLVLAVARGLHEHTGARCRGQHGERSQGGRDRQEDLCRACQSGPSSRSESWSPFPYPSCYRGQYGADHRIPPHDIRPSSRAAPDWGSALDLPIRTRCPIDLHPAHGALLEGYGESSVAPLTRARARSRGCWPLLHGLSTCRWPCWAPVRRLRPAGAALVLAYAAASRVQFAVGFGYTRPTQLVFVPELFLLPPGSCRSLVAGIVLGTCPTTSSGQHHPDRALLVFGDAWHAVGPALVFAAVAGDAGLGRLARLVAALRPSSPSTASPRPCASGCARRPAARAAADARLGLPRGSAAHPVGLLSRSPPRCAAPARCCRSSPCWRCSPRAPARIDSPSSSTAPTAAPRLLLGDMLEADDELHRQAQPQRRELAADVAEEMGLDAAAGATSNSARCSTTSARSRCPRRSSTSRGRSPMRSGP